MYNYLFNKLKKIVMLYFMNGLINKITLNFAK